MHIYCVVQIKFLACMFQVLGRDYKMPLDVRTGIFIIIYGF